MASLIKRKLMGIPNDARMSATSIPKQQDMARTTLARAGTAILGGAKMIEVAMRRRGLTRDNSAGIFRKIDHIKKLVKEQHDALRPQKRTKNQNANPIAPEGKITDGDLLKTRSNHLHDILVGVGQQLINGVRNTPSKEHMSLDAVHNYLDRMLLATTGISMQTKMNIPIIDSWGTVRHYREQNRKNVRI